MYHLPWHVHVSHVGTLDTLGLYNVPVGVGTDGGTGIKCVKILGQPQRSNMYHVSRARVLRPSYPVGAFFTKLSSVLEKPHLLSFCCHRQKMPHFSSVTIRIYSGQKSRQSSFRGKQKCQDTQMVMRHSSLSQTSRLQMLRLILPSAQLLFRRLQEWGVPLIVLGQRAARAAPTPRSVFDQLAELWISHRLAFAELTEGSHREAVARCTV